MRLAGDVRQTQAVKLNSAPVSLHLFSNIFLSPISFHLTRYNPPLVFLCDVKIRHIHYVICQDLYPRRCCSLVLHA